MTIESSLRASQSGLNINGQAMNVLGDNIANVNTTGFKASRIEFGDLLSAGQGGISTFEENAIGSGALVSRVRTIQENGTIEGTGRALDAAIDGTGFFVVGTAADQAYTRAGNFVIGAGGTLQTADGLDVLGTTGTDNVLNPINMYNVGGVAAASANASLSANLDARAITSVLPAAPATFNEINANASHTTSVRIYDSLGAAHDIKLAFAKGEAPNTWTGRAYINGADVGGVSGTPVALGNEIALQFSDAGALTTTPATLALAPAYGNGAAAGNITLSLAGLTQFASSSQDSNITQDGKAIGNVKSYEIGESGEVKAILDNGNASTIGTIQLATFKNVDGLTRAGSSLFKATTEAGDVITGSAQTGIFGRISGSALERSTVDIAKEFVAMIVYQQAYQGSSKALNAASQMIRETIAIM